MRNQTRLIFPALLLLSSLAPFSARAEDTLWNLDFKALKPGQTLAVVPYAPPCAGPQDVATDAQNTLAGTPAVGPLLSPLLYTKGSDSHYMPGFTLKAATAFTTGIVTVKLDVVFDKITQGAQPVETLLGFPFLDGDGGPAFSLLIAVTGPDQLVLGGESSDKSKPAPAFKTGDVAHLKAVLDLNQHTFQAFLNDVPLGDAEHDDKKFSSFLGFIVRDGTALGGNKGATFTAGLGNLVITHG